MTKFIKNDEIDKVVLVLICNAQYTVVIIKKLVDCFAKVIHQFGLDCQNAITFENASDC